MMHDPGAFCAGVYYLEVFLMQLSQRVLGTEYSPIRKFRPLVLEAEARGIRALHLNIGQPDIETPRPFFDAVNAYKNRVIGYAPSDGVADFVQAMIHYYKGLGVALDHNDLLTTYGGSEALQIAFSCMLDEGDEVLVPEPYYPNYNTFVRMAGGVIRGIPTRAEDGYRFATREQIEPHITPRTRALLVANPGNPTGVVLTPEERQTLVDIAREHDIFLISDEVYRELVYDGEPISTMLQHTGADENIVVIDSVSKRFSATGTRVGALISRNGELMHNAMKLCQGRLSVATLDQVGAAALFESLGSDYYEELRAEYHRRRDAVVSALREIPGAQFDVPEGAFYMMVRLPVDDTESLQRFLLEEFSDHGETVMFAPGSGFYADPNEGRQEIRIAYVSNCDQLRRSVELLKLGVAAYQKKMGIPAQVNAVPLACAC